MDAGTKQRMLGVVVLTVLALIFIPMLLTNSDSGSNQADLSIPEAPDRDYETREISLSGQMPQPDPNSANIAAGPMSDDIATVDTNSPERPDAFAGTIDAPQPVTELPPEIAPASSAQPTTAMTQANDIVTAAATPMIAPPVASVSAPAPSKTNLPQASANGRYLLVFGSYGQADNARRLAADLGKMGVNASTETVQINGSPGLRVISGPYADRSQAETIRLKVKQQRKDIPVGLTEVDIAGDQDTPASATRAVASAWAVQVGAFSTAADANSRRDQLRAAGFAAFVEPVNTDKGLLHRVRVGPETQRSNAEKIRDNLKARFSINGIVVSHP